MSKWVLYHSPHCPDCPPVIRALQTAQVDVEYVDITGDMVSLKRFLRLRDTHKAFDEVKERGDAGIPALIKNDGEEVHFEAFEADRITPD